MSQVLTVEDLNPRSWAVRDLRMGARRGRQFHQIMVRYTELQPLEHCRAYPPQWEGDPTIARFSKEVFGERWWANPTFAYSGNWQLVFDEWWAGHVRSAERGLLANLPEAERKKV